MKRIALIAVAFLALAVPGRVRAQGSEAQDAAYKTRREQLLKELEQRQQQLAEVRTQRVQLQTRIESVIAQMMKERANALLLSNETNALQQLDAILTSSQDNLLSQRDRFLAIGDAVRRRTGAILVVLLRADSSQAQTLGTATLNVDAGQVDTRTYSATANSALQVGAVDQLYRSNVLPTAHTVTLTVVVNGQTLTGQANVTATPDAATYVQFAVRNGQLTQTTFSSRGTTPF
jgi:hypothetical protein